MNDDDKLEKLLAEDEGKRLKMYQDTKGIWTVGIGHNLEEKGISDAVCSLMFQEDIDDARKDAEKFSWYSRLNSARRAVILNMIFNMGLTRFSGFKKTIEYIDQGLYLSASKEMKDSKWYREDVANSRSDRLAEMMRTGTWPENFS